MSRATVTDDLIRGAKVLAVIWAVTLMVVFGFWLDGRGGPYTPRLDQIEARLDVPEAR